MINRWKIIIFIISLVAITPVKAGNGHPSSAGSPQTGAPVPGLQQEQDIQINDTPVTETDSEKILKNKPLVLQPVENSGISPDGENKTGIQPEQKLSCEQILQQTLEDIREEIINARQQQKRLHQIEYNLKKGLGGLQSTPPEKGEEYREKGTGSQTFPARANSPLDEHGNDLPPDRQTPDSGRSGG